jgi:hypothetical protein
LCEPSCGGVKVGGYCWYFGAAGANCDSTTGACTGHGGYHTATLSYAGSGGTNDNCASVLTALGAAASTIYAGDISNMGCYYISAGYRTSSSATTEDAYWNPGVRRACACTK